MAKQSLADYLSERLDINPETCRRIVWAIREYILITLSEDKQLTIRGLGQFRLTVRKSRRRINFTPSTELYNYLDDIARTTGRDLSISKIENRVRAHVAKKLSELRKELNVEQEPLNNNASNACRLSLLKYLQQEFPYYQSWTHPVTKKEYSYSDILKAVNTYRQLVSDRSYLVVWSLWIAVEARMKMAELFKLSPAGIRTKWERSVDALLFIISHPELQPSNLKILLDKEYIDARN